jgi:hypothetical protein
MALNNCQHSILMGNSTRLRYDMHSAKQSSNMTNISQNKILLNSQCHLTGMVIIWRADAMYVPFMEKQKSAQ